MHMLGPEGITGDRVARHNIRAHPKSDAAPTERATAAAVLTDEDRDSGNDDDNAQYHREGDVSTGQHDTFESKPFKAYRPRSRLSSAAADAVAAAATAAATTTTTTFAATNFVSAERVDNGRRSVLLKRIPPQN